MESLIQDLHLKEEFENAANWIASHCSLKVTQQQQLRFYGLFKQATKGNCAVSKPSMFQMEARAKWDAWNELKGLQPEEAAKQYIQDVTIMKPDWKSTLQPDALMSDEEDSGSQSGGGAGDFSLGASQSKGFDIGTVDGNEGYAGLHGANVDICHWASLGDIKSVQYVLANGTDVNYRDNAGMTALMWAADRGHSHIAELLLKVGANPNMQDNEGQTPLHFAAICGYSDIISMLLTSGANAKLANTMGQTPEEVADKNVKQAFASPMPAMASTPAPSTTSSCCANKTVKAPCAPTPTSTRAPCPSSSRPATSSPLHCSHGFCACMQESLRRVCSGDVTAMLACPTHSTPALVGLGVTTVALALFLRSRK